MNTFFSLFSLIILAFQLQSNEAQNSKKDTLQHHFYYRIPDEFQRKEFISRYDDILNLSQQKNAHKIDLVNSHIKKSKDIKEKQFLLYLLSTYLIREQNFKNLENSCTELLNMTSEKDTFFRFNADMGIFYAKLGTKQFEPAMKKLERMFDSYGPSVTDFKLLLGVLIGQLLRNNKADAADDFLKNMDVKYSSNHIGYYINSAILKRDIEKKSFDEAIYRLKQIQDKYPNSEEAVSYDRIRANIERKINLQNQGENKNEHQHHH